MILEYDLGPYLVRPEEPVKEALRRLDREHLRFLVCVHESGRVVGTFTMGDLNRWLLRDDSLSLDSEIGDACNRLPVLAPASEESDRIAARLEELAFLPLVDEDDHLVALALRRDVRRPIRLGQREIGDDSPTFVIAEIGNNHQGSLDEAFALIDLARDSGADCAKFQMRDMSALYGARTSDDDAADNLGSQYTMDLLRRFQLSDDELLRCFDRCAEHGMVPLCTPWDAASVAKLEQYGMPAYKVASADLTNHELLRELASTHKPLICSTGMSTESEIAESVSLLQRLGARYVLLHCNSTYPAPFKDINLSYMDRLADLGDCPVGYSGHERDIFVSIAAVARGACLIEKHFTRDRDQEGNDHKVSLLPSEFSRLVDGIRQVELSLGTDGERTVSQGELMNRVTLAKSVFARRAIPAGEVIERDMLEVRSPGQGLQPNRIDALIGRPAPRNVAAGDVFYDEDIDGTGERPRAFELQGRWGLPVRHHDYRTLLELTNPRALEFHLSYRDLDLDHERFFPESLPVDLVVHAPELFENDHTLDLASPDARYRETSIAHMRRVVETVRVLRPHFSNADAPIGVITNVGGFSMDAPLSGWEIAERRALLLESLAELDDPVVQLWPQTMPPFPWHFGGQRFHNLFIDADWIEAFCEETGMRVCLDVSHSLLACNHDRRPFPEFLARVLPHTAHLHLADARGVDGEGLQIGEGDGDWPRIATEMRERAPQASWIPEIWQGHENDGAGFWRALARLERGGFRE